MSARGLEKLFELGYNLQSGYEAQTFWPAGGLTIDVGNNEDAATSASALASLPNPKLQSAATVDAQREAPSREEAYRDETERRTSSLRESGAEIVEEQLHDLLQLLHDCDFNHPHVTCTTPLPHVCFLFHAHRCSRIFICDQGVVVGFIDPSFLDGSAHLPVL